MILGRCFVTALIAALTFAMSFAACRKDNDEPANASPGPEEPVAEESATPETEPQTEPDIVEEQAPAEDPTAVNSPAPGDRAWDSDRIRAVRERLGLQQPEPLRVGHLLRRADIREITRYGGELEPETLVGSTPTRRYNGLRYAADDGFGFGLQLWTFDSSQQADLFFDELRETLIDPQPLQRMQYRAVLVNFAGVRQLVLLAESNAAVLALSCGIEVCNGAQLRTLALRVATRL